MEMFKKGGLKDEGGTKDPVSGNDVPSGSLKEEVRDDIDAKLSLGEFVFPADVVRFIGLQKLMQMRDKAKAGLQRMEDMGQMGNSDEAIIDDDVPFGTTDLIIVAGPAEEEMNKLNIGGMPTQQQQSNQAGGVPGQGRFDQIVGQPQFNYEVKKFRNEAGAELFIPFVGNNPVYQAPPGYTEVTQEQQQQELSDPTLPQATVQTELGQSGAGDTGQTSVGGASGMGGGPTASDVGYNELSQIEQIGFGLEALGLGQTGAFGKGVIGMAPTAVGLGMSALGSVRGLGTMAQKAVGSLTGAPTLGQLGKKGVEKDIKDAKTKAREFLAMTPQQQAEVRSQSNRDIADRATAGYMDAVGASQEMRDDTIGVMGTIGGIVGPLSVDMITGVVTDPITGDVIGGKDADRAREAAKEREKDEAQQSDPAETGVDTPDPAGSVAEMQSQDPAETGAGPGTGSGPPGGGSGPGGSGPSEAPGGGGSQGGSGPGGSGPSEAPGDDDGTGAGSETGVMFTGGLIPKRKQKKKKKKRGGLASR